MVQTKDNYDSIIIGAGLAGLVCGSYLAKAGMKVLLIERHDKPGGYFTSFKRKGFLFDAAAHSFGNYREGGLVRSIFSDLDINSLIAIRRADPSDIFITPDFTVAFKNDTAATITALADIFPDEKSNLKSFFDFLTAANHIELVKLKKKTFKSLLQSYFHDSKLINTLGLPVLGNGGLPPSLMHAFNGTKVFTESMIDGGYYPEGGVQNLSNALVQIIRQNGGSILYKKEVRHIMVQNCSACGVRLNNNEYFLATHVISACDSVQTVTRFLDKAEAGKTMQILLEQLTPSLSFLILYIGIDQPFYGLPPRGVNTWYLPHYDLDEIYKQIQTGDLSKAGMYMIRVSPDSKTILAYANAPFISTTFWKHEKKKIAEDFLHRIETLIPNLRKHILFFDAATPATLYRYTLNYKGAAYGWASTQSQMFIPELKRFPIAKNCYLAGHWTSLGSGLPSAFYSGYEVAQRILRKNKKLRYPDNR
ncbi:MAG TPA: NAD(P)/FAD-dependent oxidoreductase [Nitrospirota bacterium]|nr:NAD(P)/FAD-dependent oxidoreductase [Nitrospirota bacterium]